MSIELILGCMFSGKTTELFRRVRRHGAALHRCLIIKYAADVRYDALSACTHDQSKMTAVAVSRLRDVADVDAYDVIGIDEAQFFDDLVEFCEELANRDKVVIVAALDGTFQRKPFGRVLELVPLAEHVTKLNAVCTICHKDAAFSHRKHPDGRTIAIGGAEAYAAMCRKCFNAHLLDPS
jgi:thymidine kinase